MRWSRLPTIRECLHIVLLSSLAIAQPMLDLLGRNGTFFIAHRATPSDIVTLSLLLLIVPPALILILEAAIGMLSPKLRSVIHVTAVAILVGLTFTPPLVRSTDMPPAFAGLTFVVVGTASAIAYLRLPAVDTLLTWAGFAPLVFLGAFLFLSPIRSLVVPGVVNSTAVPRSEVSPHIVFVIFDEFALNGLLDRNGEINRLRFPNFARLSDISTWYPNATTVHDQSRVAVTSILTGRLPPENSLPAAQEFPQNLFTLLGPEYDLHVREAVTSLCPPRYCPGAPPIPTPLVRVSTLVVDTLIVYLHTIQPSELAAAWLPTIADRWAGFGDSTLTSEEVRAGLRNEHTWLTDFLGSLSSSDKPTLFLLHSVLPHAPWRYLPTGQVYENDFFGGLFLDSQGAMWRDDRRYTDQGVQRFLLQSQYVDRFVGDLMDRLTEIGVLDESLLIVVADHGISFEPGSPRRNLSAGAPQEDILPIPLFIKLPGQELGSVDTRIAQTTDLLPTIADALEMSLSWDVDGVSLLAPPPSERVPVMVTSDGIADIPTDLFAESLSRARYNEELFGNGSSPYDIFALGTVESSIGRSIEFTDVVEGAEITASISGVARFLDADPTGQVVPARVTGTFDGDIGEIDLAFVLNQTIVGVAQSYFNTNDSKWSFSFLLPPWMIPTGCSEVALYQVHSVAGFTQIQLGNPTMCPESR